VELIGQLLFATTFTAVVLDGSPSQRGELRLYQGHGFAGGEYVIIDDSRPDVQAGGIVRSVAVHPGERWEVCSEPQFKGRCTIIKRSLKDTSESTPRIVIRSARRLGR
jgi:hypothetical protein